MMFKTALLLVGVRANQTGSDIFEEWFEGSDCFFVVLFSSWTVALLSYAVRIDNGCGHVLLMDTCIPP